MTVYVIGSPSPSPGPVKIGWTRSDPQQRLIALRMSSDTTLTPDSVDRATIEVLYHCDGDRGLEHALHLRFHKLRVLGEWFGLHPAVAPREVRMAVQEIRPSNAPQLDVRNPLQAGERSHAVIHQRTSPPPGKPRPTVADQHFALFSAWIKAGFTEDQALKMIAMMVTGGN